MTRSLLWICLVLFIPTGCTKSLDDRLLGPWKLTDVQFPEAMVDIDGRTLIDPDAIERGDLTLTYTFTPRRGMMVLEEAGGYRFVEYYLLSASGDRIHVHEVHFDTRYDLQYELVDDNRLHLIWPDEMVMRLIRETPQTQPSAEPREQPAR